MLLLPLIAVNLLVGTSLTSARAIDGPRSARLDSVRYSTLGQSSVRRSLNFGPDVATVHRTGNDLALARLNLQAQVIAAGLHKQGIDSCSNDATQLAACLARISADAFVAALHGSASTFTFVGGYLSTHNGIYHAHYVQHHNGLAVVNGNLNVNLDTHSGEVVSFGDSSSLVRTPVAVRAASWANQVIFGAPVAHASRDPRSGLLAFLSLATGTSLTDSIGTLRIEREGEKIYLHGAPGVDPSLPVKASLVYLHDGPDNFQLVYHYSEVSLADNLYEAFVTANGVEQVVSAVDLVRDFRNTQGEITGQLQGLDQSPPSRAPTPPKAPAPVPSPLPPHSDAPPSYRVYPWGVNDPSEGKRELLLNDTIEMVNAASPHGWHTVPAAHVGAKDIHYADTRGNNVFAQENFDGGNSYLHNYRPTGGANMTFDFAIDLFKSGVPLPPKSYIDASVTQLFYTCNVLHDFFYAYGFTPEAGNFQEEKFGVAPGGDAVQVNAQDGSGYNNANFMTPGLGSSVRPRMRMYVWTNPPGSTVLPQRDGVLEEGIVIHEYAHGVSTRLTGNPENSGCLGYGEAGGMGEGWGDFFATMIRMHSKKEVEFSMGEWASKRNEGIRNFKYSRNMTVNPDTYATLDKPGYWGVHAIGEVWAEMLFEVAEIFIAKHGFEKSLFPPAAGSKITDFYSDKYPLKQVPAKGNTLIVQLVVDGMKLQPCRPSFKDARDAILVADKVLTGGDNACLIWKGFAKRGLGPAASLVGGTPWGGGVHHEDYTVPKECL